MIKKYNNLEDFISRSNSIPILPENLNKINELISNENVSIDKIARLISLEPSIAAKVLKIANSVYYGRINKVVSINEAIVVIGLNNIRSMLITVFIEQFYNSENEIDLNILRELWKHSIMVAMLSSKIMEIYSLELKEPAYTAGLLHDVGEMILFKYENELYKRILEEIKSEKDINRLILEEMELGFTHTDLGAFLARTWNLNNKIKDAIFFHHIQNYEELEEENQILSVIILADLISMSIKLGGSDNLYENFDIKSIINKKILNILELDEEKINYLIQEAEKIKTASESLTNFI